MATAPETTPRHRDVDSEEALLTPDPRVVPLVPITEEDENALLGLSKEELPFFRSALRDPNIKQALIRAAELSRKEAEAFDARNSEAQDSASRASVSRSSSVAHSSGSSPVPCCSRRSEADTQVLLSRLHSAAATQEWRSCIYLRLDGPNLVAPDGTTIPVREIEIEDPGSWPNTRFRFLSQPRLAVTKKESVLLAPKLALEAVLSHLSLLGVQECREFAFGTSVPLPRLPVALSPFGSKMLKFLTGSIPEFLWSGKRPSCEESKPFVMVLPASAPDLLPLATAKRLDASAGISQLGEGFPLISDGSLRAELEKRAAFFQALSNLALIDSLSSLDWAREGRVDKNLFAALAKALCQSLSDSFYGFIAAKQSLRAKVLKGLDHAALPVKDLLNSCFLDSSLFGREEVTRITAEARTLHISIWALLQSSSNKRRAESSASNQDRKRPRRSRRPNNAGGISRRLATQNNSASGPARSGPQTPAPTQTTSGTQTFHERSQRPSGRGNGRRQGPPRPPKNKSGGQA